MPLQIEMQEERRSYKTVAGKVVLIREIIVTDIDDESKTVVAGREEIPTRKLIDDYLADLQGQKAAAESKMATEVEKVKALKVVNAAIAEAPVQP